MRSQVHLLHSDDDKPSGTFFTPVTVLEELCTSWRPNSARLRSDLSIVGEFTPKTESPKSSVGSCPSPRSKKCFEAFMMRVSFGFVKQC
nr:hypothetical protein Iba_chr03cCG6990 [Ipomoea batatas]